MNNDILKILLEAKIDKQSINNIQSQINNIKTQTINVKVNTTGTQSVNNITNSLEKLEQVTKKNLSLDLDRLSNRYKNLIKSEDVANIKQMINSLQATDPKLGHNIDLIKVKMKEVGIGAENSRKSLDLANKSAMSFGEAMKTAAYKFTIWSAITASYYKLIREIADGIKFVNEMDSQLTQIGVVLNQNRQQVAGLAKEYNNLAKELKVTTTEVASAAVEFYRQGLSQDETMERLRTTTMYSKIANLEFTQSAELLTATVNSMGIDIERAADVFTYLGDATATGADEIGIGFSKTGGAAAALGVEFEKVASWIAVISSRTRESAESIGFSINTMLSRMSRITSTGFNEDDEIKLNDVSEALNEIGIALTDSEGNFRNFGVIIDEVGAKFNTLSDKQKAYTANVLAGTRQQSRFYNLMEGYTQSIQLYEGALESANTTQEKFNVYLESNQATLDRFKTEIEDLWLSVIDSDSLMDLVRGATTFVETLDNMVEKFGTVGTALSVIIPLIGVKLVWAIRSAYIEMIKLQATGSMTTFMPTITALKEIIKGMLGLKVAAGGATIATTGLTLATAGLTLGIGLLVAGIIHWVNESKKAEEAMANALDNSKSLSEEINNLEKLKQKQKELTSIEGKSVEQKEELLKIQRELAQKYPELATGIDLEGNKIAESIKLTDDLTETKKKLLEQELLALNTLANAELPKIEKDLDITKNRIQEIVSMLESGDTFSNIYDDTSGMSYQIDNSKNLAVELQNLIEKQQSLTEKVDSYKNAILEYNNLTKERAEREKWIIAAEIEKQAKMTSSIGAIEKMRQKLLDLGFTSDDVAKILSGNLDEVANSYDLLTDAQIENLKSVTDLDAVAVESSIRRLNNDKTMTETLIKNTKARIIAMQTEMNALLALTGGKANTSIIAKPNTMDDLLNASGRSLLETISKTTQNKAIEANRELATLEQKLKNIDLALANIDKIKTNNGKISSGSTSKGTTSTSTSKEILAEADRYQELNLQLEKLGVLLAKNKSLQELAGDDLEKKIPLMEEEIELTKQRQIALHNLNNERRAELLELEKTLSGQGFTFEGLGDSRVITNLDHIQGKTKEVEEQFKRYIDLQSSLLPQASQEWWTLQNTIQSVNQSISDLAKQQRELLRVAHIKKLNEAYNDQQKALSSLEEIQERIVAIIRKRGEEEMKALDLAYQKDMEQLDERHNKRKKQYTEELDEFRKMIQGKLDALDDQYAEEDYLKALQEERDKATELQKQIDVLSLDTSLTAKNQTIELRKQLAEQNKKIAEMQQKRERDLVKKSLEDQLKGKEKQVKEIEDIADDQYKNDKKRLEEDYRIAKEYHERKYSDEKVYSEARQAILDGEVEVAKGRFVELEDAFRDFEDAFGKGMGILGDIIKDEFSAKLKDAQDLLRETANLTKKLLTEIDSDADFSDDEIGYKPPRDRDKPKESGGGSSSSGGKLSDMTSTDYAKYVAYKQLWEMAKNAGDNASMKMANDNASALRKKYGITSDLYSYNDLKGLSFAEVKARGYKHGGKITETGTLIAPFHGEKNSPEWIFNDSQLKDILKNTVLSTFKMALPKIPSMSGSSGGNQYQILFDVKGNLDKSIMPDIQRMITATIERVEFNKEKGFKKIGITRPV